MNQTICRSYFVGLMLLVTVALPLNGQVRPNARSQHLRQQIERSFAERLKLDLALTDEQMVPVQRVMAEFASKRDSLESEERRLKMVLTRQLRPGVAADEDILATSLDGIMANRVEYAQLFQAEMKKLGEVLTPVQRAQVFLARDRLLSRAREMIQQRPREPGRQ